MVLEILSQLSAHEIQKIKTAAFIAAFFINRQAIIILAFHLIGEVLVVALWNYGAYYFCVAAAVYSINAAINIKLLYEIRQALICIACINWLTAFDYFYFTGITTLNICYPWLINGLDVFILFCLLFGGGWWRGKIYRTSSLSGNNRLPDLQLR